MDTKRDGDKDQIQCKLLQKYLNKKFLRIDITTVEIGNDGNY